MIHVIQAASLSVQRILESGIGRAHNIALASLRVLLCPAIFLRVRVISHATSFSRRLPLPDGTVTVPDTVGLGLKSTSILLEH
jgi:hypothetical protein